MVEVGRQELVCKMGIDKLDKDMIVRPSADVCLVS
jgi:hypothetical protein